MRRALCRTPLLCHVVVMAFVITGLSACEEESQGLPPPESPPSPAASAPPSGSAAASAANLSAAGSNPNKEKLEEAESVDDPRSLPFLRHKARPTTPNPVFQGDPIEPSKDYRKRRVRSSKVSPIERHWGKTSSSKGALAKDIAAILDEEEPTDNDPEKAEAKAGEYRLVMYRLNVKTGVVDTFSHAYHSNRSREAALARKTADGYRLTRPSAEDIKDRQQKAGAGAKANKKGKSKAKKSDDDCPVRVTWTTGDGSSRAEQSRCFKTREEARRFQQERRKAAGIKGNRRGARKGPKQDAPKAKPPSRQDNSLQPQTR